MSTIMIPENLSLMHILLAYAGLLLHLLFKIKKAMNYPGYKRRTFFKKPSNIISLAISVISIPIILVMACDPAIAELMPINNVTSVFAGWQTNSAFRNLMAFYSKKGEQTDAED